MSKSGLILCGCLGLVTACMLAMHISKISPFTVATYSGFGCIISAVTIFLVEKRGK